MPSNLKLVSPEEELLTSNACIKKDVTARKVVVSKTIASAMKLKYHARIDANVNVVRILKLTE